MSMGFKWLAGAALILVAVAAGVFVIGNPLEAQDADAVTLAAEDVLADDSSVSAGTQSYYANDPVPEAERTVAPNAQNVDVSDNSGPFVAKLVEQPVWRRSRSDQSENMTQRPEARLCQGIDIIGHAVLL